MKQLRLFFTAVCLILLLSVPVTAWAAETKQGPEAGQKTGSEKEAETGREEESEQKEAEKQDAGGSAGTLWIRNAAAGTGERLPGAVFVVYEADGIKRGELTLQDGEAFLSLPAGNYYLKQQKAPAGYGVEPARILFDIVEGETALAEVTSEIDLTNVNPQDIIPQTGEPVPVRAYIFSILCFAAAFLCGLKLRRMDGGNRKKGGARLWQYWS